MKQGKGDNDEVRGEESDATTNRFTGLLKRLAGLPQNLVSGIEGPEDPKVAALLAKEAEMFDEEKTLPKDVKQMLEKVSEYATLELNGTLSELKCLEQMNRVTAEKYGEFLSVTEGLGALKGQFKEKYKELQPVFKEIEDMDNAVTDLEKATDVLDAYSKRLEEKAILMQAKSLNKGR